MPVTTAKPPGSTAIRPFTIEIPDTDLADLRRRLAAWEQPALFASELRAAFKSLR